MPADVRLSDHGSIIVLTPDSDEARAWCEEHLPNDAPRWGAHGYAVEPRYVGDIVAGMEDAGLEVSA